MQNRTLKLLSGPLAFALCLFIGDGTDVQVRMMGVVIWMLLWWVTSALPVGVTALLPIVLFPMLNIMDLKSTTANYANPVIYLFLGGFILGLAIEKWNLHKRIALNIMRLSGDKPTRIILGSMLATALLSMWISNTATTVMMLPIGISVVKLLDKQFDTPGGGQNFALTIMLGIAYAANIGGISTLIGTPPNLVLASMVSESDMTPLSFAQWMFFALPLAVILFTIVYWINSHLIFPVRIKRLSGIKELIKNELLQLGKIQTGEKRVLFIMIGAALLWIFRGQLSKLSALENLSDPAIAIFASIALFAWPSGEKKKPLLVWKDTQKLPWGILLLFGGGISLAKGLEVTQIVDLVGTWISDSPVQSAIFIILMVCAFSVFLTEVMSNVALVSVFIPVSFVIASNLGLSELQLALPLTIGASCAFMFPISTPPNAIVFSSGYIKMNQMARSGILLNLICIVVISLYCYWFQEFFFSA